MCRPSLLCSIELTLTMCTVEQKFETTRLAETFVETFGHLVIICCIASIPHASSIIGTGAVNGKPCFVIFWHHIYMARFCWATFVRNPVDHIVYSRTPLMRLSPAVACFTDGLVEAGDRMAFALFLFNIKKILAESKQTGVQAPSNGTSDKSIESGKLCVCSVSWPRIVLRIMVNIIVFFR